MNIGDTVGSLTVIELIPGRGTAGRDRVLARARVRCICGAEKLVIKGNLRSTRSCGCQRRQLIAQATTRHGSCRSGVPPEYRTWRSMKARTTNPNSPDWKYYGGRGVTVCERWLNDFAAFLADMGPRPPTTSLDRIDPNGNYEPGNCRWADPRTQAANRRKD